jgi:hypothetical protein
MKMLGTVLDRRCQRTCLLNPRVSYFRTYNFNSTMYHRTLEFNLTDVLGLASSVVMIYMDI